MNNRPNVVLILTDDQGYGDLGFHGNPDIDTPNLDRLASEGIDFTNFCASPVCSPTRASLMTGRYNYRTGVVDTYMGRSMMHPDEVTIAELLSAAGYHTGLFGKWHLGDNYPMRPIDKGFQEALYHRGGGLEQPAGPPGNTYFDPVVMRNKDQVQLKGYCTDIFTDGAIEYIKAHKHEPFFLYLATNAPHDPLHVPERYVEPYLAKGLKEDCARVYGMITNLDENVGRIMQTLKETGLEDNTILIFMTDNGPCPYEGRYLAGLRGGKCSVYDGGIRVQFFMRWPAKLQGGRTIDRMCAHIDVLPTLLEACGATNPEGLKLDGISFMPLLSGQDAAWPDRQLCFQWHRGDEPRLYESCCVRTENYKLVNGCELYDLKADPGESTDISADHPEMVARMRKTYEDWFADVSSTRGYDPPRIVIGSPEEPVSLLTRQDWRGPRAGWAPDDLGYWEVTIDHTGNYDITLTINPVDSPSKAHFSFGDTAVDVDAPPGAETVLMPNVKLDAGDGRLESWVETDGKTVGVQFVEVAGCT